MRNSILGKTIYRKCKCGETAHDHTGEGSAKTCNKVFACRNCGKKRIPKTRTQREVV